MKNYGLVDTKWTQAKIFLKYEPSNQDKKDNTAYKGNPHTLCKKSCEDQSQLRLLVIVLSLAPFAQLLRPTFYIKNGTAKVVSSYLSTAVGSCDCVFGGKIAKCHVCIILHAVAELFDEP